MDDRRSWLLRNAALIDGAGRFEDRADVLVMGGRVAAVGCGLPVPRGVPVVDLDGLTMMPGLIDAHTHLSLDASPTAVSNAASADPLSLALATASRAAALVRLGVTTVRDVGGVGEIVLAVRKAISEGLIEGPRLLAAGRWITSPRGHGWPIGVQAATIEDLIAAVRSQVRSGVDLVKVMVSGGVVGGGPGPDVVQFSAEQLRAMVETAEKAGLGVAAHAHSSDAVRAALEGGVRTIEHATFLTEELAAEIARRGVYLVPTIAVCPKLVNAATLDPEIRLRAAEIVSMHHHSVEVAVDQGIVIAAGTDLGVPCIGTDAIHDELDALAAAGLGNDGAIRAATEAAAAALGLADVGRLEVGCRADVVVLRDNPLDGLGALRAVEMVMQFGRISWGSPG